MNDKSTGRKAAGATWVRVAMVAALVGVALASAIPASAQSPKRRVFVNARDAAHKQALKAIISARDLRHEFISPGNELIFSAELTRGQIEAVKRLGGRVEAVPRVYPLTQRQRYGALQKRATPLGKPVCGDGVCQGNESKTCPADCGEPPPPEPPPGRECAPQDQREYQTLLLSGSSAGGWGVKLLVVDTGVNKDHADLDVSFCRNVTRRKVKNNCKDDVGHGTHTSGSAAANGGLDGLGLFGAAPGATLGMEKVCTNLCWLDDLARGIEDGTQNFHPQVMTISIGGPDHSALKNAIDAAVAAGTLIFSSSGNSGPGANTISYPAAYPNVVAVGMLDAVRIANRMSSRGIVDDTDSTISARELELTGGGFVIESTSFDGCYEIMSGTSMSSPSVAGFAAANWQGFTTRSHLQNVAQDINNSAILPGYDDTVPGFDTSTGYGLPRNGRENGSISASVNAVQALVPAGQTVNIVVSGPVNSNFRIGVTSPAGDWTFGEFTTDGSGNSALTLTPWTDPGTWLLTVDFGGGATDFGAAYDTFQQTN